MISYSKALDDEELIKAREESRSKPDFEKDYAKFLKKYKKSLKHHKPGYYFVPAGQGDLYQYCESFTTETEKSEKLRKEFEKKYPHYDYVSMKESWSMMVREMSKAIKTARDKTLEGV